MTTNKDKREVRIFKFSDALAAIEELTRETEVLAIQRIREAHGPGGIYVFLTGEDDRTYGITLTENDACSVDIVSKSSIGGRFKFSELHIKTALEIAELMKKEQPNIEH
jgi:hypothetical protein